MTSSSCPSENSLVAFVGGAKDAQLEAHFASCERCRIAVALLSSQTYGPRGSGAVLNRGENVGRYIVLELIGEGAMGRVYSAYDPVLDRKVALKLIRAGATDAAALARQLQEAKALARVTHPNLVAVHDAGEFEGSVFIAMEFVDGVTLRTWRAATQRTTEQILDVYRQAGRGLAAAHQAELVHRDFKPENVLVGSDGRVRVSDFGLARFAANEPVRDATALSSGLAGTPAYMAPEQLALQRVDARADQFSFAVALYEALALKRPFTANLDEHVRRGAEPLTGVAPRVERALQRALQVDASARFPTLGAMLVELEPIAPHSKRPLVAIISAAAVIALALGLGLRRNDAELCASGAQRMNEVLTTERVQQLEQHFKSLGAERVFSVAKNGLEKYGAAWASLHRDVCEATRVRGEQPDQVLTVRMACLERRLLEVDGVLHVLATTDAASLPRAPDAVTALTPLAVCNDVEGLLASTRTPENPQLAERVRDVERQLARATALKDSGRFREGLPLATSAALEAHSLGWAPLEAEALLLRGELTDGDGDIAGAEPMLRDAWASALAAKDDRRAVLAAVSLSFVLSELNRMKDADDWAWQAQSVLARAKGDFDLEARLTNQQGHLLFARSDYAGAEVRYRRAYELRKAQQGADHPQTAAMLANVAGTVSAQGHYEDGLALLREVARVLDANLDTSHPKVGQAHNGIAEQLLNLNRPQEALAELEQLVPVQERALGSASPYVARLLINQGAALLRLGRVEESLAINQRAADVFEKAKMPLMVSQSLLSVGDSLVELGRTDEGIARYRKAREALLAAFGDEHEEVTVTWEAEGEALLAAGRAKEALAAFEVSLQRREKVGSDDPNCAFSLSGLGRTQQALGQRAKAKVTLERAVAMLESSGLSDQLLTQTRDALK
ncbi:MAG: serine/threonine-protein kinase [Archangium sp.]